MCTLLHKSQLDAPQFILSYTTKRALTDIARMHCFDCDPNVPNDYLPRAAATSKRVKVVALSKQRATNFLFMRWSFSSFTRDQQFERFHTWMLWRFWQSNYALYLIISNYFFDFSRDRRHCRLSLKKIMQTNALFWTAHKSFSSPWKLFFLLSSYLLPCRTMVTTHHMWMDEMHYELLREWHVSLWSGNFWFLLFARFLSEFLIQCKQLRSDWNCKYLRVRSETCRKMHN